ncbi:UbiA prenyltransferase family-domain-containing protein [Fimicolochytrium jonesii]|uniref:UbiA prenyltransferase family-domain-containing protein n=1 Tax=Fimicolochytrium jonesii TaxID=1396493 RepID=UPI0022FDBDA5|nr:UbiA prenyltransferase family-domain-containing protein [Fimicolochytrium jonesii]KAI8825163.1 UbiA prenyltransferase family-domain-containing protein [Fimicolochytrium jonesii]
MVALSFIWVTHLQTHYNNEYFDLQADLANDTPTKWTGGSRVLVDGLLPTWSALAASVTLTVFGILSVWGAKWDSQPVVYIAIAIMTLAWSYTSPPVRLHYHSLGELTVATVLTVLTPLFGFATQPGTGKTWETFTMPSSLPYLLAILAIQQWARMVVMNIPDVEGDLRVSKITFAARIGVRNAANIYYAVQVLTPFLALIFLPWPLSCAFLSLSLYGLKAAKKVKLACNSGSWNHIDETVSIPFEATGHCAGTALACTTAMILLSLAGSKAGL